MDHKDIEFELFPELDAEHYYFPGFLTDTNLYNKILKEVPFRQEKSGNFIQPRLSCLVGDPDKPYYYSGHTRIPVKAEEHVLFIMDKVNDLITKLIDNHPPFTSSLCNYYENGHKYIMIHSDNEKDLDANTVILSVSLGATRFFDIHEIKEDGTFGKLILRLPLTDGSVFIMGRGFQSKYAHKVPKQLKIKEGRINLTFRVIKQQIKKWTKKILP